MNEKKGLTAEEVDVVREAFMKFTEYANNYVVFHKIRSGELGLTAEEEKLVPLMLKAQELLGIK